MISDGAIRMIWGLIPSPAMSRLQASGRLQEARAEILADAEATLKRIGQFRNIDCCFALEDAAKRWLARHPNHTKDQQHEREGHG